MLTKIKKIFSTARQNKSPDFMREVTQKFDTAAHKIEMIISIHLPKTAGSSFSASLESHFGTKFLKDTNGALGYKESDTTLLPQYERYKKTIEASLRIVEMDLSRVECIHGHIYAIKYLLLGYKRDAKFVTWMRNPVDRVISQYQFWKKHSSPPTSALHQKVIEENWSLERFCLGPELRNIYGEMLWGFPLEYFDFIGITEFYEDDFNYFARHYLDSHMNAQMLNVGDNKGHPYQIDSHLRKEIEAFHGRDMHLYQRALETRQARCAFEYGSVIAPQVF